ncbi:MAG: 30S ribosome-binding factor RbfA [Porticoccaceae bacterium]
MAKEYSRAERVADAVQRELVELIRDEMRDPRVSFLNITAVDVSRDMSVAKVHVNFVAGKSEDETREAIEALNHAAGFLRSQLAKVIRLRTVPRLRFYYDASSEHGQRLSALIDRAIAEDRERHTDEDE